MTRNEAMTKAEGKYATGDFLREIHGIVSSAHYDRLRLSCGHEVIGTKGIAMLREMMQCNLCAKAWIEEHTTK